MTKQYDLTKKSTTHKGEIKNSAQGKHK